jgi:hypothetical protein
MSPGVLEGWEKRFRSLECAHLRFGSKMAAPAGPVSLLFPSRSLNPPPENRHASLMFQSLCLRARLSFSWARGMGCSLFFNCLWG